MMIPRHLEKRLRAGLRVSPAIPLAGARQVGKTTLIQQIANRENYAYRTLDDLVSLGAASTDPIGFLERSPKPVILDEVQRCPELFLPIKADIDANRTPGRYILTGSANPLLIPKVGEALTGRMLLYSLLPLSQGEILGNNETFLRSIFEREFVQFETRSFPKTDFPERLLRGGFPTMQELSSVGDQREWCNSYLQLSLQKDVRDLAHIEGLKQFPNLLHLLATRVASLLNVQELSRTIGLPSSTLRRYLHLLETLFLIVFQPAWSNHLGKRLVKSPKVYFIDTALQLHLLGFDEQRLRQSPTLYGSALENFCFLELLKQASWDSLSHRLFHFRTQNGAEVDIVVENAAGNVVGIEIKSSTTLSSDDFRGLKVLRQEASNRWIRGIILYGGSQVLAFEQDLIAMPYSCLWALPELKS